MLRPVYFLASIGFIEEAVVECDYVVGQFVGSDVGDESGGGMEGAARVLGWVDLDCVLYGSGG